MAESSIINDEKHEEKHGKTPNGTPTSNGDTVDSATKDEDGDEESSDSPPDGVFPITVKLPHEPYKMEVMVSYQEQVQDIRQSIIDLPYSFQYSCFHLEAAGKRVNDFVELSEIPGVCLDSEVTLVEDPYTEKEARMHVIRTRDLIGAAGDRTDAVHGISAGLSLHDSITQAESSRSSQPSAHSTAVDGYDFDAPPSIRTLLPPTSKSPPTTVKSISLSSWNPPPYHLRTQGHLLYLQVTTSEGDQHHITSHVSGFYVNKSSNTKFDPFSRSSPRDVAAHSLLTLISKLSPSFEKAFKALQEHNSQHDPLVSFQLSNALPASPWLVDPPDTSAGHVSDITRTQESYLISGVDNAETLRDWNEEFQSTRELPKEPVQERVFRERLTSKLFADYTEAATRGAVLVARGEVPPLNPTEAKDAQIFVYNNVFFSFSADGVGTFATEGRDEAARVATGKDVMGVRQVNQFDIPGLFTPGTVIVDYLGKRIVGQSIVPGIFKQREPGQNQIDYGGVEGKDIVAGNQDFVGVFEQLSKALHVKKHPVWDKEGKRHDLEGSVETKGLLGTDGRKYVLDLYRLTPLDITWLEQYWSEESEGTVKPKEKNYPHRMAGLRLELVESYYRLKLKDYISTAFSKQSEGQQQDEAAPEALVNGTSEAKAPEKPAGEQDAEPLVNGNEPSDTKQDTLEKVDETKVNGDVPKEPEEQKVDVSGFKLSLNPDVFCGQVPQTEDEKEEWAKDELEVRAACEHLTSEVIPRLIRDLQEGEVGFPMDGQSLTVLLHKRGINIRYLGNIATLAEKEDPRLQALRHLSIQEMVSRGVKHVINQYLRNLPPVFAPSCVAHLLNCLLGSGLNQKPRAETDESLKPLHPEADFSFETQTPALVREAVADQVHLRYRFDLGKNWIQPDKELQMLREVSLKLGLQLEAKDYSFNKDHAAGGSDVSSTASDTPVASSTAPRISKKKKRKNRVDHSSPIRANPTPPSQHVTFHPSNVQNFVPVVKEASPRSLLADEALDAGRMTIAQDQKDLGRDLLLESLSLYEQIYGVLHPEVARAYYQLSTLYYSLDDKDAAVELARKAVIVSERTVGVDSVETILSYLNLGLFEHASGNQSIALAYFRHALELWKVVYGAKHPDSITTLNNAAVVLQSMKQYHASRVWFEASLAICEEVSGRQSINTATILFQLAQALALDKDMRAAVNRMRESYTIFLARLGPQDRNTREAESWLEQLTQNAVLVARQAKDLEARKLRRVHFAPSVMMGTRAQLPMGQTSADAVRGGAGGYDSRSIDELLKYIEGDAKKTTSKKRTANPKRRAQRAS